MATRLIVMSPRPGLITHEYDLDFSQRYFETGDAREVKSAPDFIAMREEIAEPSRLVQRCFQAMFRACVNPGARSHQSP